MIAAALAGWAALRNLIGDWRHQHHARHARQVTIAAPPQVEAGGAGALWANLHGLLTPSRRKRLIYGTPHLVWQYSWTGRHLQISVWVPGTVPAGGVEAAVRAAWPGAATTTQPVTAPIPDDVASAVGGHLALSDPEWLPLEADHADDPLRALMSAGAQLKADEYATVQILTRPAVPKRIRRARRAAGQLRTGRSAGLNPGALVGELLSVFLPGGTRTGASRSAATAASRDPGIARDVRLILEKTAQPLWQTGIRYAVAKTGGRAATPAEGRVRNVADAIASSFAVYTGRNRLGRRQRMPRAVTVLAARRLGAGFLTGASELAALAALPRDLAVPGLDRARAKSMPVPVGVPSGGRGVQVLGDAEVGGHSVGISVEDARYHTHMVGQTGSGKTTLLANMIIDDIKAGRGTVVLDPHGDLILDVLDRIPESAAERIVLFDPDQENPPTLNPLEGDDPDLVVDNLVSIFSSIFTKAWGPRMDDVMRVSCLTLLRHPNVTLQHIPPLLNSAQFRSEMVVGLDDPDGLAGFWQWYDSMSDGVRAQVIGPVLARLRAFLLRDFVKRTMRSPRSSFDMGKVLDGGILLVRIPKGVLGEDTARLLGSLILARVWQAAAARANTPVEQRKDCSIYLDEAQNFLTLASSLDTMLAEARKYRLRMILAHQDLAQFPRELLAAASANARNKIFFSVAPEDARVLARHTLPELDEHDLSHLDAYTAAARLMACGRQTATFTMKTRPPRDVLGFAQQIRDRVAERTPVQDASVVDQVVRKLAARRSRDSSPASDDREDRSEHGDADRRQRRPKGTQPRR
ncbi:type IV secretion system DNA-binding domain-containing protein [Actinoplanes sp. NPDC051475]|uniref:type IV secretory system conjugative DNA transfer family protein n=1 Tax=Actinoplanes sp. NPDC051475 TaxID=3157225 RepID=UPI00344DB0BC